MILSLDVTNKEQFITAYLDIWIGSFKLTDKERIVLKELLLIYLQLQEDNLQPKYINKLLFSTENRKIVRENVNLSEAGLNNYFTQLKDKNVIFEENKELSINSFLVPVIEVTFKFNIK